MNNPTQAKPVLTQSVHVETVVQEYMDNLLVDLFPDVAVDKSETSSSVDVKANDVQQTVVEELTVATVPVAVPVAPEYIPQDIQEQAQSNEIKTKVDPVSPVIAPIEELSQVETKLPQVETKLPVDEPSPQSQSIDKIYAKPDELRYPQAPIWAQQAFEVLLFDVCGLKLAVPMESLGKIIKVEHETSQLIGRPDWFIGAYIEQEQHLYVVDTAKYIMPEKGFDLANTGFEYVIQLQRSKWTLACKKVHSTVRIEPDQIKWRSQQGKRKWLSGTVVDHMCALIHVDSLIELLEAEAK